MERVIIFIDGANFYNGLKRSKLPTRIDYELFGKNLCTPEQKLIRILYFNAPTPREPLKLDISGLSKTQHPEQISKKLVEAKLRHESIVRAEQGFFSALERTQYVTTYFARKVRRGSMYVEKGVDILLACHLIDSAHKKACDVAILVSGDDDFVPAVELTKSFGLQVANAYFRHDGSENLKNKCDFYIEITPHMIEQSLYKKRR